MPNDVDKLIYDEAYWNAKHPKIDQLYDGRPLPGTLGNFPMDVRRFLWADDVILKKILDKYDLVYPSHDDTAGHIQRFVVDTLTYIGDNETLKCSEYWLFAGETLQLKRGDCEDGAILIASMLLNALPASEHWRVRVSAGWVQASPTAPQGGHGYCTYCRCLDNQWVALDWCYLEDSQVAVVDKPMIKNVACYKDIWFSFNHQYAWGYKNLALAGRVRKDPDHETSIC